MRFTFREMCAYMNISDEQINSKSKDVLDGQVKKVVIDSRLIQPGDVFFAFRGDRVNGEDFVEAALAADATAVIVSQDYQGVKSPKIIPVEDVQWSLQELAKGYRKSLNMPIVAISGSVGKTSTKDLMAHVLSDQLKVFKTKGNFNNELGLPLMILELDSTWDVAVLEMGMNHAGELERLVDIATPKIAVLTNIGTAHIEFFGTREGIFKAKMELASRLKHNEVLILNGQDDLLATVLEKGSHAELPYRTQGIGRVGDVFWSQDEHMTLDGTHFTLCSTKGQRQAFLPLCGHHHILNALLSLTVAAELGLDLDKALNALATVSTTSMRFEKVFVGPCFWINDAYNASIDSMIPAVETLVAISDCEPWVVFGDVFECGDLSASIHTQIGLDLNKYALSGVIFIGHAMLHAFKAYSGNKYHYSSVEAFLLEGQHLILGNKNVLFKASRGMSLERIIKHYQE